MIAKIVIVFLALMLAWFVRDDVREYRLFETLTSSTDRCARYRLWCIRSFAFFTIVPVVALALLGRAAAIVHVPTELAPVAMQLQISSDVGRALAAGIAGSTILGAVIGVIVAKRKKRYTAIGEIAALIPHNGRERSWAAVLSLCAGVGEELLFRLLFPLLLVLVGAPPVVAVIVATLIFGIVHVYQGMGGVLGTTLLGAIFALVYLASRLLWLAMMLHALVNLNGLVLRPWLAARAAKT